MPTRQLLRRDPCSAGKGFSTSSQGFTIIELMIVLVIIAVCASLAMPSYRAILEKRQVTSAAEQIGAFLAAVQMESVKRNQAIAVSYTRTDVDAWCLGLATDAAGCDCNTADPADAQACTIDGALRVFPSSNLNHPDIMDAMTGDGTFVFDPVRGLMVDHGDIASMQLLSSTGLYALSVDVIPTGRVRICSGDSSREVPGYESC